MAKKKSALKKKSSRKSKLDNNKSDPDIVLQGKQIAFFGKFKYWPKYHKGTHVTVAKKHGATVINRVDDQLDIFVLGDQRGTGRAEAKKKAEAMLKRQQKAGVCESDQLMILDEAGFRDLVSRDISGKSFSFCGGFDCCPGELHDMLQGMVEAAGAENRDSVDSTLDYLVVGNRRGKGKAAAIKAAEAAQSDGSNLELLDEAEFLELVRLEGESAQQTSDETMSFAGFVSNVYGSANEKKVQRALKMLQKEKFQLYSKVTLERVAGVVSSQTSEGSIYSPWIDQTGKYGCSDPDLSDCMGLQGSVCKHLLVLLLGLVKAERDRCRNNTPVVTARGWQATKVRR